MFSHYIFLGIEWCFWDIPALILLAVAVVFFLIHRHKQKKREKEYEELLEQAQKEGAELTGADVSTAL